MARKAKISEQGLETRLGNMLRRILEPRGGYVVTFENEGVLTQNRGLVVALPNRQEFQLTIVESTRR